MTAGRIVIAMHDFALEQHHDPVAHVGSEGQIVGDEYARHTLLGHPPDERLQCGEYLPEGEVPSGT